MKRQYDNMVIISQAPRRVLHVGEKVQRLGGEKLNQ
jgi:hypothetical protein